MSTEDVAFPTVLQLYFCVQKRFSLAFSRHRIQSPMSRRSRCRTPSVCFTFILLAWTPPQRPSPIPLASNYAMPHHHALTCTSCSITPSTVREELRIVNDILLKSTRAIVPTSLRPSMLSKNHYYHRRAEYCLRFTYKHVFSLPYLLPVWKASRHWPYYPILSLHDLGCSSRRTYLSSNISST